jgi:cytochrome c553
VAAITTWFLEEAIMKILIRALALAVLLVPTIGAEPPQQGNDAGAAPSWAYPVNPPDDRPAPDDGSLKHVPGSSKAMTRTQALDSFNIPDWHPDEHPAMPEVVEHGRKPAVRGCGYCHLPNGLGRPENSGIAGLPAAYIEQQMADFKGGARKSSEPKMGSPAGMIVIAEAATDADVKAAAEYFSTLKLKPWIRVVETNTVPKTHVSGSMLVRVQAGGTEPIGRRIIETPEDLERTELRDAASGFIAYVPVGSIKKGEALVTTGGAGKTTPCGICHGPELRGLGPVPALAGRSPSYIFRQLFDMQHGVRKGAWSDLMKAPLAKLSEDDLVSITAYISSRTP